MNEHNKGPYKRVSRQELKPIEKRKILENFVENDEALGQLLDFISSHYIQPNNRESDGVQGMQNSNSVSTLTSNNSNLRGIDDPLRQAHLRTYMAKKQA